MQCPLCLDSPLEPKFSHGIEIDICPRCRGVWLDRGEIDRLVNAPASPPPPPPTARPVDWSVPSGESGWSAEPRPGKPGKEGKQGTKPKSKAKRLADLFEEVLDL
jgi:Zn-finger nucleic acid-binding protein